MIIIITDDNNNVKHLNMRVCEEFIAHVKPRDVN